MIDSLHVKKQASNLAKLKATKDYLEILKNNGLDPSNHLSDEQKDLLEEEKFIERRKQELGKK